MLSSDDVGRCTFKCSDLVRNLAFFFPQSPYLGKIGDRPPRLLGDQAIQLIASLAQGSHLVCVIRPAAHTPRPPLQGRTNCIAEHPFPDGDSGINPCYAERHAEVCNDLVHSVRSLQRDAGTVSYIEALAAPLLRQLAPETAHHLALRVLEAGRVGPPGIEPDPILATEVAGVSFRSPLGLAAGFDKDARAIPALGQLGFGHIEVGTVTPRPQPGNPRPRLFRLRAQEALINRLGFPSAGLDAVAERLAKRPRGLVVGANVGCNRATSDPVVDIVEGIVRLGSLVDYVCVNVSSPNTPGLRDLQTGSALDRLLERTREARREVEDATSRPLPLFLKVAPDLTASQVQDLAERLIRQPVDGLAVSNTTIARPAALTGRHRREAGGLSGRPLFGPSTRLLAALYQSLPRSITLIGIGGISGATDAWQKIEAGAGLVQLYTGFVYQGTGLIHRIHTGLAKLVRDSGHPSMAAAIGTRSEAISEASPHA